MENIEEHIDNLKNIKATALGLLETLKSDDPQVEQAAMRDYVALVDHFYKDNEHLMAPAQYDQARKDVEYFLRLVELAIRYFNTDDQAFGQR